jgi:RimJ/RimL family protein N-acetyltransferase
VPVGPVLRPLVAGDTPFFTRLAQDPRVVRWVRDGRPWTDELIAARTGAALDGGPADAPGAARWFVAELAGAPVALVVAMRRDDGSAEVGYWVDPDHWGGGIATAALGLALAVVPGLMRVDVLVARVHPDNGASAAVLGHHGFLRRGAVEGADLYVRPAPDPAPDPDSAPDPVP